MLWLVLLLVIGPLVELWFILQVAQVVGGWQTLALLFAGGIVGGWLIKHQGRAVIRRIDERLRRDELPTKELADGFLLLAAGVLMLAPGFLTDIVGFALILPPTRALARAALLRWFTAKMGRGFTVISGPIFTATGWRGGGDPVFDTTADEEPRARPDAPSLGPGPGERHRRR